MAKRKYDEIDRYLEEADTIIVPQEYISAACVTDLDGNDYYISFDEVADIMSSGSLESQGIKHIRAIIDMDVVRETVIELSERILNAANI
jgi:hypothetical protein